MQRDYAEQVMAMYGEHIVVALPRILGEFWVNHPHIGADSDDGNNIHATDAPCALADSDGDSDSPSGLLGAGTGAGAAIREPIAAATTEGKRRGTPAARHDPHLTSATVTAPGATQHLYLATEQLAMNLALRLHELIARKTTSDGVPSGDAPLGLDVALMTCLPAIADALMTTADAGSLKDRYRTARAQVKAALGHIPVSQFARAGSEYGDIVDIDQLLIPALTAHDVCVRPDVAAELSKRIMRGDDEIQITKLIASMSGDSAHEFAVSASGLMTPGWLVQRLEHVVSRTPQLLYQTLHSMNVIGPHNPLAASQPPVGFAPCSALSLVVLFALDLQGKYESVV